MKRFFDRFSYSTKLFFTAGLILLISIVTLSLFDIHNSSRALENEANAYLKSLADVTLSKINDTVGNVENIGFFINGDSTIQDSLEMYIDSDSSRQEKYYYYDTVRKKLSSYVLFNNVIESVDIFTRDNKKIAYVKNTHLKTLSYENFDNTEEQYWMVDSDSIMFVKDINTFLMGENLGKEVLCVNRDILLELMDDLKLYENGKAFLIDSDGVVVATADGEMEGKQLTKYSKYITEDENFYRNEKLDNESYSIFCSKPISNGWRLLLVLPRSEYIKDVYDLRLITFIIMAVILFAGVIMMNIVTKKNTRSIRELSDAMEKFGQGDFDINCNIESSDEIGKLSQRFNSMVDAINSLVNSVYEQKVMLQKAQMKSLEMQINPHFLYNTLDTINWMARAQHADDVGNMAASLGNMMRYSLSRQSFVRLRDEVKILKDFLYIQNFRYGDRMSSFIEIDEELLDYSIPKLIVQPILENAVVHGIEEKIDSGTVSVTAWLEPGEEGDDLYISVEDDGVGMTEENILQILQEDESIKKKGHTSIGIVNVNKRIQMIYGKNYGLMIQSALGAGTKMTIHIKASKAVAQ